MNNKSLRCGALALAWLIAGGAPAVAAAEAPAPTAAAATDPLAEVISRCFALRRSDPAVAVELARTQLSAAALPVEAEIKLQSCLGVAAGLVGDSALAIAAADRIEHLMDSNPLAPDFMLRALSNAGVILHGADQISRAEALYQRAFAIAQAQDMDEAQISTLINIALIHADYLDAPEVADAYYRKAVKINADSGQPEDLLLYFNYAANLARLGRNDEALAAMNRAQAIAEKDGNAMLLQRLNSERAGVLIATGEPTKARALLDTALIEQRKLSDPSGIAASLSRLSQLQLRARDARGALENANAAVQLVEGSSFRREQLDALAAQSAAYAALGQTGPALAAAARRHAMELGSLKQHDVQLLANLQAQQQDTAGQREIERLRHQSQIQTLELARNALLRNGVIVVLSMFVFGAAAFSLFQRRVNRRLRKLSTTDMLTGLASRRAAVEWLGSCSQPGGADVLDVVLLIDIDRFKSINDRFGHDVGDRVLTEVSQRLKRACRPADIISRWGGEEFLVGCPGLSREQAGALAERLRAAVADRRIRISDVDSLTITVSIGFAPLSRPASRQGLTSGTWAWQSAVKLADRALYAAKNSGRNAWVGFWGQGGVWSHVVEAILKDPDRAIRGGHVAMSSSRPVIWLPQAVIRSEGGDMAA